MISGMSSLWSSLGLSSNSSAKAEKQKAAIQEDLKYLYSAFTKIPCLRLAPDNKARLISGYEEFPFDSAVPLFAFKNLTALEIYDVDFRQFYGWDRLAEQLRSLTVKRAGVDDPADLLIHIVLDDIDRRRRRSAKAPPSPAQPWPAPTFSKQQGDTSGSASVPSSPVPADRHGSKSSPQSVPMSRDGSGGLDALPRRRQRSVSPARPTSSRHGSSTVYGRNSTPNIRRSSGSSGSSVRSNTPRGSSSNLLSFAFIPSTKWRFLRHLSLADNSLTNISASSLSPLINTLQSLDLSSNLFTEIPDSLATLVSLRALNLSNCMIESLHSLAKNPLPAITTLNLRANRLTTLAGIERLLSLERVDLRDNRLGDPTEIARLTGIPDMLDIYVSRNPFVKTHSSYRVTIFNLFRKTPGYTEDVTIDSTGPGYSERKQLVDRAPEPANVPVVKPPPEDEARVAPVARLPKSYVVQDESHHQFDEYPMSPPTAQRRSHSDYSSSTRRRRKVPRRRIVELSQNDALQQSHSDLSAITQDGGPSTYDSSEASYGATLKTTSSRGRSEARPTTDPQKLLPLTTTFIPPHTASLAETPPKSPPAFDVSSDIYKKKIEALRQDFGPNWLSALGEDAWDGRQRQEGYPSVEYNAPVTIRPTGSNVRTASQGIVSVSSGRTLG